MECRLMIWCTNDPRIGISAACASGSASARTRRSSFCCTRATCSFMSGIRATASCSTRSTAAWASLPATSSLTRTAKPFWADRRAWRDTLHNHNHRHAHCAHCRWFSLYKKRRSDRSAVNEFNCGGRFFCPAQRCGWRSFRRTDPAGLRRRSPCGCR